MPLIVDREILCLAIEREAPPVHEGNKSEFPKSSKNRVRYTVEGWFICVPMRRA